MGCKGSEVRILSLRPKQRKREVNPLFFYSERIRTEEGGSVTRRGTTPTAVPKGRAHASNLSLRPKQRKREVNPLFFYSERIRTEEGGSVTRRGTTPTEMILLRIGRTTVFINSFHKTVQNRHIYGFCADSRIFLYHNRVSICSYLLKDKHNQDVPAIAPTHIRFQF